MLSYKRLSLCLVLLLLAGLATTFALGSLDDSLSGSIDEFNESADDDEIDLDEQFGTSDVQFQPNSYNPILSNQSSGYLTAELPPVPNLPYINYTTTNYVSPSAPYPQFNYAIPNESYPVPAYNQQQSYAPSYQAVVMPSYQTPAQQTYTPVQQQTYQNAIQQTYQVAAAQPAQPTYQAPAQPVQPQYQAPAQPAQPTYQAPAHPAQPTYQAPAQPAQPTYQAPAQPTQPTYQAPAQPAQPTYQAPAQPAQPTYQAPAQPAQPTYQAPAQPAQPTYQAPAQPAQPTYQAPAQPAQPTYQAPAQPAQPTYQPPAQQAQPTYQAPAQPTQPTYQAPAQPAQPTYQAPAQPAQPTYQAPAQPAQPTYQAPAQPAQPTYQAPAQPAQPTYQAPAQPAQPTYQTPAKPVYQAPVQQQTYQPATSLKLAPAVPLVGNYSKANSYHSSLNALFSAIGYLASTPNTIYYKAAPYQTCPKNIYLNGPSQKEILEAFAQAQQQLNQVRGSTISYINSTQHTFAARHAHFSFLSQLNPRMDEEGLLVEYVSLYLANKACMTKWDKHRYLPSLTKLISTSNFPPGHSCSSLYQKLSPNATKYCQTSKYRTFDGFCNNPYHPYWGKANVCHLRLLSPDYADGISAPRVSYNPNYPLPNPRGLSNYIHFELPLEGLYNLMKMQWGQFINHDITNTALSSYDGLVDCCKNPTARGCWPIYVPPGDSFYSPLNVTCLNFIRSGVCPLCQLGPRQQTNKNTAFLDLSHIYGHSQEQSNKLRVFKGGLLVVSLSKNGEPIPPIATGPSQDQCAGICFQAGDNRVNQHPALTALHTLSLRRHNQHAQALGLRHPEWNDEILFQEARRINIAEYQMITFGEYMPIVFGPLLSSYYKLYPLKYGHTQWDPKVDPTTWNEYSTAACRFGHSQCAPTFGLYSKLVAYRQQSNQPTYRLKDWYMQPSFIYEGLTSQLVTGLLSKPSEVVDPWITSDTRDHLYKSPKEHSGGDLAATNIWRGRDHGIPGYVNYLEYCFNFKVYSWNDLNLFIPPKQLANLRKVYGIVENIDLFTGGLAERHFPGADIGPTFACINGIQYYHLKYGDRYYFEHGNQAGSFNPAQLQEIRQSSLARLLCRTANLPQVPYFAFLAVSNVNPAINCVQFGEIDYNKF